MALAVWVEGAGSAWHWQCEGGVLAVCGTGSVGGKVLAVHGTSSMDGGVLAVRGTGDVYGGAGGVGHVKEGCWQCVPLAMWMGGYWPLEGGCWQCVTLAV